MITVSQLTYDYPGVRALDDVSFHLPPGSITALVGPNGAGKTTLLRCLAALEEPVCGDILIRSIDVRAEPRRCHRLVGYLSDFFGLYEQLTVRQCLIHAAAVNGIPADAEEKTAVRAAQRLGIADRLHVPARTLSRGLRQRLGIAQAVVHDPKVLLLDEPASGLDPEARHSLAELFLQLRNEGMTLLVSSHILAELEEYSTDMLVLRQGRIVSHEPVNADRATGATVRLTVSLSRVVENLVEAFLSLDGVTDPVAADGRSGISFTFPDNPELQRVLLQDLVQRGLPVCSFGAERRTMQDAYLATVADHRGADHDFKF
jgi:ABC-2 type transport system ATP-binding protein